LIIMPDIEKRLEAFVRIAHGIIIFPGGAGTAEELLYLLGVLLQEPNQSQCIPVILTGPAESTDYFAELNRFIEATLGVEATKLYQIIVGDAVAVGQAIANSKEAIREARRQRGDAFSYNWSLDIPSVLQTPFIPSHGNMANLNLTKKQPVSSLAADPFRREV